MNRHPLALFVLLMLSVLPCWSKGTRPVHTYSIVAIDKETGKSERPCNRTGSRLAPRSSGPKRESSGLHPVVY